jgi:hypothetical protein
VKFVPRPHGTRPAELVEPRAKDSARGLEIAFHQKAHRQRCGVPAARSQPAEQRVPCRVLVEVKGLRIEFGGKRLDALALYA